MRWRPAASTTISAAGSARYSTDERWLVPHFEKMLYDNALLVQTYLEAYQVTKQPCLSPGPCDVLDYILREMTDATGGFYSATDADSEGVEGKFFVWTPDEIQSVLPNAEDARRVCAYYDITERELGTPEYSQSSDAPLEVVPEGAEPHRRRTAGDDDDVCVPSSISNAQTPGSTRTRRQNHHRMEWHDDFGHGRGRPRARPF